MSGRQTSLFPEARQRPVDNYDIVCTEKGSVYCTRFSKGCGYEGTFKTDMNTHITYWMPLPEPPKEGE